MISIKDQGPEKPIAIDLDFTHRLRFGFSGIRLQVSCALSTVVVFAKQCGCGCYKHCICGCYALWLWLLSNAVVVAISTVFVVAMHCGCGC